MSFAGSRKAGTKSITRSISSDTDSVGALINQIRDIIAVWTCVFELEMAIYLQTLRTELGQEGESASRMVEGKLLDHLESCIFGPQSSRFLCLFLQGNKL